MKIYIIIWDFQLFVLKYKFKADSNNFDHISHLIWPNLHLCVAAADVLNRKVHIAYLFHERLSRSDSPNNINIYTQCTSRSISLTNTMSDLCKSVPSHFNPGCEYIVLSSYWCEENYCSLGFIIVSELTVCIYVSYVSCYSLATNNISFLLSLTIKFSIIMFFYHNTSMLVFQCKIDNLGESSVPSSQAPL